MYPQQWVLSQKLWRGFECAYPFYQTVASAPTPEQFELDDQYVGSECLALYAFGNRKSPRLPRASIDIAVDKDIVKPTQPPTGASTFADIRYAPLTGHYYRIDKGTTLPVGLAVIADGEDVG